VKIYVAAVEALGRKERQDETQFTTKDRVSCLFIVGIRKLLFLSYLNR
jgi:hypothetical protein